MSKSINTQQRYKLYREHIASMSPSLTVSQRCVKLGICERTYYKILKDRHTETKLRGGLSDSNNLHTDLFPVITEAQNKQDKQDNNYVEDLCCHKCSLESCPLRTGNKILSADVIFTEFYMTHPTVWQDYVRYK